jgi:uncharacterized membrane protein
MTILALDLHVPRFAPVTSGNLITGILRQWPSYFAFVLSFTTILIMWINHHARLALVERVDGLLMFGNGLVLMTVVVLSYPTTLVGQYLNPAPPRQRSRRTDCSCSARASHGTSSCWRSGRSAGC